MYFKILNIVLFFSLFSFNLRAEEKHIEIGIEHDKRLGKYVPLDLEFTNSNNSKMSLKEIIKKPTVLALVYYHCPGVCSPLLTNLSKVVDEAKINLGEDYQILSVSFDPTETYEAAQKWKKNYTSDLRKENNPNSWSFMVGDSLNVKRLTEAVGFYYKPDGQGDFIHTGALIILSPDGKITRYLLGTEYLPFDFKLAITEASQGIATPPISKFIAYCFKYDPKGHKYIFNINRVAGTLIFLSASILLTFLLIKGRKKSC